MSELRLDALQAWQGWEKSGLLYQWNADILGAYPSLLWDYGTDCSGFVCAGVLVATKGRIDWRNRWWADRMHHELPVTTHPRPGDLAVYGTPEKATHVMVVVGDGRVLGACGGDSTTKTKELAIARGARVRFRPKADYRTRRNEKGLSVSDFLGFRVCSPLNEGPPAGVRQ